MAASAKNSKKKDVGQKSRRESIRSVLSKIEARLEAAAEKATLADFIRLTQLERELEEAEPAKEIVITWVDPMEREDSGG